MKKLLFLGALLAAMLLPTTFAPPARASETIPVVASFSILADLVRAVGGARVAVTAFVGPDADMHAFQPAPADARRLRAAHLVVVNGLGFEGWTNRLVKASGYAGPLAVASDGIRPLKADDGHGHGAVDPHAWQDVANVKTYVANIRAALTAADPPGAADYAANAARYLAALDALDAEVKAAFADIPLSRRRVITSHAAFAYYGRAYGIAFLAPQGVSSEAEPTARDVAALIRQIKRTGVKALFVENIADPRLIERITRESGAQVGGALYSDALSPPEGPAPSYLALIRHNTRLLAAAMR